MVVVAAGVGENKNIEVAADNVDFKVILSYSEDEFINMIREGFADAYVRGSLGSTHIIKELRKMGDLKRASYIELDDHKFLLAPVGIDEGFTIDDKIKIIEYFSKFMEKIGLKGTIAVISGGRPQDIGRAPQIDKSIKEAEKLTSMIKDKYDIKHYYILIEDAIEDKRDLILAPDGITGNLIFRSLVLVGSAKSHGAITLGIDPIFIDTSRAQTIKGYERALKFAYKLARMKGDVKCHS
ncbi:putative methanogen marker protein 4 [Methanothermobacter sp. MT-2]|nr:putative methanogen marker protein 4 [Methanothermobacter sp. MT-2]